MNLRISMILKVYKRKTVISLDQRIIVQQNNYSLILDNNFMKTVLICLL